MACKKTLVPAKNETEFLAGTNCFFLMQNYLWFEKIMYLCIVKTGVPFNRLRLDPSNLIQLVLL